MERKFVEDKFEGQGKTQKYITNVVDKLRNKRPGSKKLLVEYDKWQKVQTPSNASECSDDSDSDSDKWYNSEESLARAVKNNTHNGFCFYDYICSLERNFMTLVQNGDMNHNWKIHERNRERRTSSAQSYKKHCVANGFEFREVDVPLLEHTSFSPMPVAPWKRGYKFALANREKMELEREARNVIPAQKSLASVYV
jgi:hypothetical protein